MTAIMNKLFFYDDFIVGDEISGNTNQLINDYNGSKI